MSIAFVSSHVRRARSLLTAGLVGLLTLLGAGAALAQNAYVPTGGGANNVSVINTVTNTVVGTLTVGSSPWGVAASSDGTRVYIANSGSGTVSVINTGTNTVIATVPVGSTPAAWPSRPMGHASMSRTTVRALSQ